MHDEGNWRCVVTTLNHEGDKLGPLIHLHVFEFGHHFEGGKPLALSEKFLRFTSMRGLEELISIWE